MAARPPECAGTKVANRKKSWVRSAKSREGLTRLAIRFRSSRTMLISVSTLRRVRHGFPYMQKVTTGLPPPGRRTCGFSRLAPARAPRHPAGPDQCLKPCQGEHKYWRPTAERAGLPMVGAPHRCRERRKPDEPGSKLSRPALARHRRLPAHDRACPARRTPAPMTRTLMASSAPASLPMCCSF